MAKAIMVQGTMSNSGKSFLTAGLCRVFKQDGYKVAPFKSQNMALNSYITKEGLEIGRAQAMQAEACGIDPTADMNPILLKPTSNVGSQVIVNGEVRGNMKAMDYYRNKKQLVPDVMAAYERLSEQYDIIVIEGAGSPAEINLKKDDIVNMGMAELVDAPVLLVGDIDRGGVFAQIAGTVMLLEEKERKRIAGTVINKFRGDVSILEPGLRMLEEKTDIPVTGVVPYFYLDLDEEDSLTERFHKKEKPGLVDIAVIRFPRISNFTDLAPLEAIEEVSVRYISSPADFGQPDLVILPGSKNTISDLLWMRQNGLEAKILRYSGNGGAVFGICGGYQMLGREIQDPDGIEEKGTVQGLGLLPVCTVFGQEKRRTRVEGKFRDMGGILKELQGIRFNGYEIHMGRSEVDTKSDRLVSMREEGNGEPQGYHEDGAQNGNVYGCYVHGIFDEKLVSEGIVSAILKQKGYDTLQIEGKDWNSYKEEQYDQLADILRESLDMKAIYKMME